METSGLAEHSYTNFRLQRTELTMRLFNPCDKSANKLTRATGNFIVSDSWFLPKVLAVTLNTDTVLLHWGKNLILKMVKVKIW